MNLWTYKRSKVKVTRPLNALIENLRNGKAKELQTWYTDGVRRAASPTCAVTSNLKALGSSSRSPLAGGGGGGILWRPHNRPARYASLLCSADSVLYTLYVINMPRNYLYPLCCAYLSASLHVCRANCCIYTTKHYNLCNKRFCSSVIFLANLLPCNICNLSAKAIKTYIHTYIRTYVFCACVRACVSTYACTHAHTYIVHIYNFTNESN